MYKSVKLNEVKSTAQSQKNRTRNTDIIRHENIDTFDPEGIDIGVNNISLVNNIDSPYESNLIQSQTFRHEMIKGITSNFNTNQVYSRRFTIDIPREFGYLGAAFLKLTINTGTTPVTTANYLSTNIIKTCSLRVKNSGTVLQLFNTSYVNMRIDELKKWNVYEKLINSINSSIGVSITGVDYVYYPLFLSFFQDGAYLPACNLDQLELYVETNDSYALMGFGADITSLSAVPLLIEAVFKYYNRPNNSDLVSTNLARSAVRISRSGHINPMGTVSHKMKEKVTQQLSRHYGTNIFYEDTYAIGANAGTQMVLLRCNKPVIAVHGFITFTDGTAVDTITGVNLVEGNYTLSTIDFRINYDLFEEISVNEDAFFSYFVGSKDRRKLDDRTTMNFAVQHQKKIHVSYAANTNVTSPNLGVNRILTIWSEYITSFKISEEGSIYPDEVGTSLIQNQGHVISQSGN